MDEPRPSFEWIITSKCNYNCVYCCQRPVNKEHCSDETVNAVFALLSELQGSWLIKLCGGEPLIHPRFFEICKKIVDSGHKLCMTTNFSLPLKRLQQLIDLCGDKLESITASLHLSQVKDIDEFIEKTAEFNSRKNSTTDFIVTSVVVEEKFERLKEIEQQLRKRNVAFKFQALKAGAKYVEYRNDQIEKYISDKFIKNTEKIKNKSLFGTLCHTGELFFVIHANGDVSRCYNVQPDYSLGNITKGTFTRFQGVKPCMAQRCTCTLPADLNMIRYGQRADKYTIIKSYLQGLFRNFPFIWIKILTRCVIFFKVRILVGHSQKRKKKTLQ